MGKKNINFIKLATEFIKQIIKNKRFKKDLKNLSEYTNKLYEITLNDIKNYSNNIDYSPINLGNISVRMRNRDKAIIVKEQNIGEISVKFDRNYRDVID